MAYFLIAPFIYLVSILPFPLLYLFSDLVYFVLYHIVRYRRNTVLENLRNAFPGKSEEELQDICKAFFKYLCDLFLETFKTLAVSSETMLRHCSLTAGSLTLFEQLAAENKSVLLVMGHLGNWEWAGNSFSLQAPQQLYVIYHPIANKHYDRLMYRMRTRFGTKLIEMKKTYKEMLGSSKGLNATAFIADQTPQPDNAYWTTFLNQDTPVFKGTEVIARKLNLPVVYARVRRIKRGYYEVAAEMLVADPAATKDGAITELHTKRLERDIVAQPETWLWSHRRWKHKRK